MRSCPAYLSLTSREFQERIEAARDLLQRCELCPRKCKADRSAGQTGFCGVGASAILASCHPHFGEEPVLVGTNGSGTVFFSGCNLGCVFCQNYEISHLRQGTEIDSTRLTVVFLKVQAMGCHNLNLVTPTHVMPVILEALAGAVHEGFSLPIVYNTGGYESRESLMILKDIVDIYMPDVKSFAVDFCTRHLHASDYPQVVKAALATMADQVGDFLTDQAGRATRGLLIRHLVMPERLQDSLEILNYIGQLPIQVRVNVMEQYHPCYRSWEFSELSYPTPHSVYRRVREYAAEIGLTLCG